MTQALSAEQQNTIELEESTLGKVLSSLQEQLSYRRDRLRTETVRARTLTSELVNAVNDEDKQLVASDEAVAHSMRDLQIKEVATIPKLLKNPYFARLVVEEETDRGTKEFEYRIGLLENPDCRILDWRKAPIAKLYYDYKEGDYYDEEVLGKERSGQIKIRNLVTVRDSALKEIQCRYGTFKKDGSNWLATGVKNVGSEAATTLQQIAAMLSPEQFKLLEANADRALVLHGVAGSGKTTLGLHRLSWLLGQTERGLQPERCTILVSNAGMKSYLKEIAEGLGLATVKIEVKEGWQERLLLKLLPSFVNERGRLQRNTSRCPSTLRRVKASPALVAAIEEAPSPPGELYEALVALYSKTATILEHDRSKLIASADLTLLKERAQKARINKEIDDGDEPLLLLLAKRKALSLEIIQKTDSNAAVTGLFDHIVVDEAQDYSTVDLAAIVASVESKGSLTIVGDTAQNLQAEGIGSWQSLMNLWKGKEDLSNFVTLSLSYRSTIEIRKYASALRGDSLGGEEGRHGRTPIWFQTTRESRALEVAREWITKSLELYPNGLTTVLCATAREARELASILAPSFRGAIRYADSKNFNFHAGIVVAPVDAVRGMEFSNLFIWNPSTKNFPNDDYSRNLLYIAVTRSRENIAMVTFDAPSALLPKNPALVRIIDYKGQ